MARKMSEREYAEHRDCARSTVQAARRTGRLRNSVTKDEQGRIWVDPKLADAEWKDSTREDRAPLTGPTAPRARRSKRIERDVAHELAALLASVTRALAEHAIGSASHVVAGAVETLRERDGREPTAAALRAVLLERPDAEAWWAQHAIGAVLAAVDGVPEPERIEMARRGGREAVTGESDGTEG